MFQKTFWTARRFVGLTLLTGCILFILFALAGGLPPFIHYLLPIVMGIILLLPRSQHMSRKVREQNVFQISIPALEKHEIP